MYHEMGAVENMANVHVDDDCFYRCDRPEAGV